MHDLRGNSLVSGCLIACASGEVRFLTTVEPVLSGHPRGMAK